MPGTVEGCVCLSNQKFVKCHPLPLLWLYVAMQKFGKSVCNWIALIIPEKLLCHRSVRTGHSTYRLLKFRLLKKIKKIMHCVHTCADCLLTSLLNYGIIYILMTMRREVAIYGIVTMVFILKPMKCGVAIWNITVVFYCGS